MNELALFAGAGGGILGGKLLGWRTVCAVEFEPYARDVLVARQNDGSLEPFPIWDDVCTFDGKPWRGAVDVVSGGFPCQDISCAGTGAGLEGSRSGLWREMARIIGEVRPRYVFVENSPMLTSRGLGVVLGDLAALGFDARWGVLGAVHAGAPHRRERIWIVAAHPDRIGRRETAEQVTGGGGSSELGHDGEAGSVADADVRSRKPFNAISGSTGQGIGTLDPRQGRPVNASDLCSGRNEPVDAEASWVPGDVADAEHDGPHEPEIGRSPREGEDCRRVFKPERPARNPRGWWLSEPDVGRVADGVAARVDRLRALGNGQVPACAAMAWRVLTS